MAGHLNIYGIKNCDTCRKALKWLDAQGIAYSWVDVRDDGLSRDRVRHWLTAVGGEKLINRRSTTWRQLEPEQRPALDSDQWIEILLEQPTLIKRPVFEADSEIRIGFTDEVRGWLSGS